MDYKVYFAYGYGNAPDSNYVTVKSIKSVSWHNSAPVEDEDDGGRYYTTLTWISFKDADDNIIASFREQDVKYFERL